MSLVDFDRAFAQPMQHFQVSIQTRKEDSACIEVMFDDEALAISSLHIDRAGEQVMVQIILPFEPSDYVANILGILKQQHGDIVLADPDIQPLQDKDWVSEVQQSFKPMRYGRFYVHGSHHTPSARQGDINIMMDAGAAFGTGEHETTGGCLLALDGLAKSLRPRRILDVGTGTGILAIAASHLFAKPVLATDIDQRAVSVARNNVALNRLHQRVQCDAGVGFRCPSIKGRYDLIIANILAKPLMKMAKDMRKHLSADGTVILSGLLVRQEARVLNAYHMQGIHLVKRIRIGDWSALILRG
ncbi:MAG: 50S ribosomal protein L11 methyltransferase [Rickettsiales bacterium]|nr:50S ribosomal protein L11 methyltransferase [Rickettsiales bacterium]